MSINLKLIKSKSPRIHSTKLAAEDRQRQRDRETGEGILSIGFQTTQ